VASQLERMLQDLETKAEQVVIEANTRLENYQLAKPVKDPPPVGDPLPIWPPYFDHLRQMVQLVDHYLDTIRRSIQDSEL
jgi:hypothetical protein